MSLLLRTTALMLLVLSRAPAFAALPTGPSLSPELRPASQNQISAKRFKHSLSGLYGIQSSNSNVEQPVTDFDALYQQASIAQQELEAICSNAALLSNAETQFAGIKSRQRALQKVEFELDGKAERITDLARATIIADDVASLVNAYEVLDQQTEIVKVKNRFKQPGASGYRDLNVLVRLPNSQIIAEVQLHLKSIAAVKNGEEHKIYEAIQRIERNAAQEGREINELEQQRIVNMRNQSKDMYQQAWQPYITTHIQAA
ncbi:phosphoribosylglycinamide formyltransferase [Vibrio sp.]|uniref:phosphoribosylglycinamide formyltransferase n=1 Tax=Vibrio sp. TaxID=678 RepID=UPI003D0DF965